MVAKVLIVEDNPVNMRLLEHSLTSRGYEAVRSVDGDNLVDLVLQNDVGLVLMDIQLPKYSGLQLLEMLRQDKRTALVPVIAVTAFADSKSLADFKAAGFNRVLTKPYSIATLLDEVQPLLTP